MRKKMSIANNLYLGQDVDAYWLEVRMPDGSAAAISLNNLSPITGAIFRHWAKETMETLEQRFLEQVAIQFEGESGDDEGSESHTGDDSGVGTDSGVSVAGDDSRMGSDT